MEKQCSFLTKRLAYSVWLPFVLGAGYWVNRSRSMCCCSEGLVNCKVPVETATTWCVAVLPLLSLPLLTPAAAAALLGDVGEVLLEVVEGFWGVIMTVVMLW